MDHNDNEVVGPEKVKVCTAYLYNPRTSRTPPVKEQKVDSPPSGKKGSVSDGTGSTTTGGGSVVGQGRVWPPDNHGQGERFQPHSVTGGMSFMALCGLGAFHTTDSLNGFLHYRNQFTRNERYNLSLKAGVESHTTAMERADGQIITFAHVFQGIAGLEGSVQLSQQQWKMMAGGGIRITQAFYGLYMDGGIQYKANNRWSITGTVRGDITRAGVVPGVMLGLTYHW
jgi:hypothetical protein